MRVGAKVITRQREGDFIWRYWQVSGNKPISMGVIQQLFLGVGLEVAKGKTNSCR